MKGIGDFILIYLLVHFIYKICESWRKDDEVLYFDINEVKEILDRVDYETKTRIQNAKNRNPYEKLINLKFDVDVSDYSEVYIDEAIVALNKRENWDVQKKYKIGLRRNNSKKIFYILVTIKNIIVDSDNDNSTYSIKPLI